MSHRELLEGYRVLEEKNRVLEEEKRVLEEEKRVLLEKNRVLEREKRELKEDRVPEERTRMLEEENMQLKEQLQTATPNIGIDITPRKVKFLKQLTSALEKPQNRSQGVLEGPSEDQQLTSTPRVEFQTNPGPADVSYNSVLVSSDTPPSAQRGLSFSNEVVETMAGDGYHWEESVTNTGVKKVKLVENIDVFISQGQLSHALHSWPTASLMCSSQRSSWPGQVPKGLGQPTMQGW